MTATIEIKPDSARTIFPTFFREKKSGMVVFALTDSSGLVIKTSELKDNERPKYDELYHYSDSWSRFASNPGLWEEVEATVVISNVKNK